jgi:GNAT superfamily N-acetyltransferase
MLIRHAAAKDIPEIVTLGNRFLKEVPVWGLVIRTEGELTKLDQGLIWVVEDDTKIVGYAICLPKKNQGDIIFKDNDKILELDEIYLVPRIRNQGIGSELLGTIFTHAKKEGYTKLFVDSSVKDIMPVLRFYRDNGLTTWSVQLFKDIK